MEASWKGTGWEHRVTELWHRCPAGVFWCPPGPADWSTLEHPLTPTFNTRSSKLLARTSVALVGGAGTTGCPTVSGSSSLPPPKSRGSSKRLRLSNPGAGGG